MEMKFKCPFCGHDATIEEFFVDRNNWFQCICLTCGEPSFFFNTPEEAYDAWMEEAKRRK